MNQTSIIKFLSLAWFNSQANINPTQIKVLVSSRIDIASANVKTCINLYQNHLNSSPDSIYNNLCSKQAEKEIYAGFDFPFRALAKSKDRISKSV
ncbi:MAG: hypothetical protein ACJAV7_001758 [Flavobacteriales bacterium]|jgi:hypothetical protein